MDIEIWLLFVVSSLGLLASPGPVVLFGILTSMQLGKSTIPKVLMGTMLGDALAMLLSIVGVGVLIEMLPHTASTLKVVCSLVLAFIALQSLRGAYRHQPSTHVANPSRQALVAKSFALTALHPGSYVFFAAFFPLFIRSDQPHTPQLLYMGTTFLVLAMVTLGIWMLVSAHIAQQEKLRTIVPTIQIAGSLWLLILAVMGVYLGVTEILNG